MPTIYLDTSALVKRYIDETGSREFRCLWNTYDLFGTSILTQAEMASALQKAGRAGWLSKEEARQAWSAFLDDWDSLIVIQIAPPLITQAAALCRSDNLRAYDAVHLSAVLAWQQAMGEEITLATFDQQLWHAGVRHGLKVLPENLDTL